MFCCGLVSEPLKLLCRLHLQRVIEAIEIIKQPDGGKKLHNFAFVKMPAQFIPKLLVNGMSIAGNALRQP